MPASFALSGNGAPRYRPEEGFGRGSPNDCSWWRLCENGLTASLAGAWASAMGQACIAAISFAEPIRARLML